MEIGRLSASSALTRGIPQEVVALDAIRALKTRRSVRKYTDQPVSRELLSEMVDCARLAATARNEQPWEFVVVTDEAERKVIADLTDYGKHIASAGACVAVFCRDSKYYVEDGSAATQNLLVAAHALALGTCWIAGDKKDYAQPIAEYLKVPGDYKLVALVSVGFPDETPTRPKRSLEEVLHWGKFGNRE